MAACLDCGGSECICGLRRLLREAERERDEARALLRDLVAAIDAETEASKVWYESQGNSEAWGAAGKRREAAMDAAREVGGLDEAREDTARLEREIEMIEHDNRVLFEQVDELKRELNEAREDLEHERGAHRNAVDGWNAETKRAETAERERDLNSGYIAQAIWSDMVGRRGFRQVAESLDHEVRSEMFAEWVRIVREAIDAAREAEGGE